MGKCVLYTENYGTLSMSALSFFNRRPVQNVPIPIFYPPEADEGLWGGVGIIKGFTKKKNWFIKPR